MKDKRWRRHRAMSDAENLDLPIPRLEIRYIPDEPGSVSALYSLVYEHFLGHLVQIPLGNTICSGPRPTSPGYLDLPFREGSHIMSDMLELGLPGYVINGNAVQAVSLDPDSLSGGIAKRFQRTKGKEKEAERG